MKSLLTAPEMKQEGKEVFIPGIITKCENAKLKETLYTVNIYDYRHSVIRNLFLCQRGQSAITLPPAPVKIRDRLIQ